MRKELFMRIYIYIWEFFKNILKYSNKKICVDKLQVWVGQSCSLRCKNCSQLFPYIKQRIYDIDDVINDLKIALEFIDPKSIHIIGGEPFMNPNIGKLVEFVCMANSGKPNKIVSNGTIVIKDDLAKLLGENNENIFVTISNYPIVKEKQEKFYKKMQKYNVRTEYVITDDHWFYMGNPDEKEIKDPKILKRNFLACWDRSCYTLAEGVLSICPRMHNSPLIEQHKNEKYYFIEHLPIRKIYKNVIGRALVATCLTKKTYRESCKYCWGLSNMSNIKVAKAEQIEK